MAWDTQAKDSLTNHLLLCRRLMPASASIPSSSDTQFFAIPCTQHGNSLCWTSAACHDDPLLSTVGFASLKADMDGLKGAPVGDADVHGTVGTSPSAGTEVDAQTTSPTPISSTIFSIFDRRQEG
ncbi:hypothetical protein BSKO_06368 [Bryopsis sp. KO-2023]|nr:hypothetical protein BSKO_05452 [Bryopsis sp. KO-2023]GMH38484.1 hypothetical protein BSKO_06368 [Bryopsis sp. KO-2023]